MKTIEETLQFKTKKELKVIFHSENLGIYILGKDEKTTDFHVRLDVKEISDKQIGLEDIVTTNYNPQKNILKVELTEPKNCKILNSKLDLSVPFETEVKAEAENGSIGIQNLKGKQTVITENGWIRVERCNGQLDCKSENGGISIEECIGDSTVLTENGSIKLKKCAGNLNVKSENGGIKLINCKGNLKLKQENGTVKILEAYFSKATICGENGSIYYEFNPLQKGKFQFENENGKIHLVIPDEIPYHITAENKLGSFHVGLKGNYERRKENDLQILEMTKGSGNVEITAKNEYGSIRFVNPQSQHKSEWSNIDMSSVTDTLDKVLEQIPEGMDTEKIRRKIEKAKKRLEKVNFSQIGSVIQNSIKGIQQEVDDIVSDEPKGNSEGKEGIQPNKKVKEKIAKMVSKLQSAFGKLEFNNKEKQKYNNQNRLKILEMLQEGKITADEAERLINAIEGHNG